MAAKKKTETLARPDFVKPKEQFEGEATNKASQLAHLFRKTKDAKDDLEERLAVVNKEIDRISNELAEEMILMGVDSFKVAGVGSIRVDTINRPRVVDLEAFITYLDEHGQSSMAPRSVHWRRLESWVKEMLENNEALPASVENYQQKRAALRRSN